MRKIFYPILLLALIACKGQQQTADSESVADPATESVNPEMGKTMVKATPMPLHSPKWMQSLPPLPAPIRFRSTAGSSFRPNGRQPSH